MASWVYVFARFTHEALLFELLIISILCMGYAGFWLLRKRRVGVIRQAVPAGVVKTYLNALIGDAEEMRAQLFGLLRSAGAQVDTSKFSHSAAIAAAIQATPSAAAPSPAAPSGGGGGFFAALTGGGGGGGGGGNDSALAEKLAVMESKMAEQAKAMQSVIKEKERIERDLAEARSSVASAPSDGGGGGADPAELAALQEKIKTLEGKLTEYSVIEDDLANLKKLQQENAQLKAALAGKGGAAAAAPAPAKAAPAPAPAPAAPAAAAFEGLVDQVEQSLQPATEPSATAPAADGGQKSDADLVAEFEKMLNS